MARTKQTARQSTGGIAPRGQIGAPKAKPRPRPRRTVRAVDNEEYTPTDCKKRKKAMKDGNTPEPATSSKWVRSNPPRKALTRACTKLASSESEIVEPDAEAVKSDGEDGGAVKDVSEEENVAEPVFEGVATVLPQPLERLIVTDLSNQFCYICQNGGSTLGCDDCDRAVCLKHIPDIAVVPADVLGKLHFRCPSCHTLRTQNAEACTPYFGLYKIGQDGKPTEPYCPKWTSLIVQGARPQHVQVDTRPIIILLIRLASLDEHSCPARSLYYYLLTWFEGPAKGSLRYVDIPFSVVDTDDAAKYCARWTEILTAMGPLLHTRVLLFIYTHSHDETGDLFHGPRHSTESLTDWWTNIVPSCLKDIATTPSNELTIAMLACGAVVNNPRPREELLAAATAIGAKRMFAFGATHLQAALTFTFFINFVQRVFLEGMVLNTDNMGTVFDQSLFLARHTPIWIFSRATLKNDFIVEIFDWTHITMRPHGVDLGLQCPGCGSLSCRKGKLEKDKRIVVSCLREGCQWTKAIPGPESGIKKLTVGEKGFWRAQTLKVKSVESLAT